MQYVNENYTIFYKANDRVEGLTDVQMIVYKPNLVPEGMFVLQELNQTFMGKGIYYYEYLPTIEGQYLFVIDSTSNPGRDEKNITFTAKGERTPIASFD